MIRGWFLLRKVYDRKGTGFFDFFVGVYDMCKILTTLAYMDAWTDWML